MKEKIGIFGKKNSIVKYNLDNQESLWSADLPHGHSPKAIAQYKDYLIVIDQNWLGTKNVSCFSESKEIFYGDIDIISYLADGVITSIQSS